MARCTYCGRRFCSEQAVKAHLKHCARYKAVKNQESSALGRAPKALATPVAPPPFQSDSLVTPPDLSSPLMNSVKLLNESMAKLNEPPTAQQQRRKILQSTKDHVIDHQYTASGIVTPAMRGAAKLAIERELITLPLEELPYEEVLELAIAIRDRLYGLVFRKKAHEAERQRVIQQAQRQKELEALGTWRRADRRKTALIDQALGQARAWCEAQQIIRWNRVSVLADVKSRLTEFLTGEESIPEAQVIVDGVLEARFAEAEAMLTAARAKADEKWREEVAALVLLGGVLALPVLAATYPIQTAQVFTWLERIFGSPTAAEPTTHASPEPPAAPASDPSPPPRTRRRTVKVASPCPASPPWGHPVEETAQTES